MIPNALHSAKSVEWGTPPNLVALAHSVLNGPPELDPASCPTFNKIVGARRIFTQSNSGLSLENPWCGTVFCNPPGRKIKEFWKRLVHHYRNSLVPKAVWIGFSVEQLAILHSHDFHHPLDFSTLILRKRPAFLLPDLTPSKRPSHAAYVTFLGISKSRFLTLPDGKLVHGELSIP